MFDSRLKAAVTGANGFIGAHLCSYLLQQDYFVRALVRSDRKDSDSRLDGLVAGDGVATEVAVADICNAECLSSVFDGVDTVFHLAGVAHVGRGDYGSMQQLNVEGTGNVLRAATASGVRRLVFFSSSLARACESGTGDITDYGRTKLEAERLLLAAHRRGEIEIVILRPVNVYGADMKGNIRAMIAMIARRRLPPLPKLENRLSLVGVDDLVKAAVLAAESRDAGGKTYYITDGETYAINEIEQAIYQTLGRKLPRWRSPRVLLYAASALAGVLGKMTNSGSGISIRTYHNLTRSNSFSNQEIESDLGFAPAGNLYDELPGIVANVTGKKFEKNGD